MSDKQPAESTLHRVGRGRHLHRLIPVFDKSGKVVSTVLKPFMVELRTRDLMQIFVGSSALAIPVAFTEETWNLGEQLPAVNIVLLSVLSLVFISLFVYANFYRHYLREYISDFIRRVVFTYILSLLVVALIMTIIKQCPWGTDWVLALKRVIIVGLPASLSATLADAIK